MQETLDLGIDLWFCGEGNPLHPTYPGLTGQLQEKATLFGRVAVLKVASLGLVLNGEPKTGPILGHPEIDA